MPLSLYRYPYLINLIQRADLHHILLSAVQPFVTIKLSSKATNIDPNTASVTLASGEIVEGDLVIGADGLRSKVLEVILLPEEKKLGKLNPKHTGDVAYRALIPSDRLLADPELRELVEERITNIWVGPERHLVSYPIVSPSLFSFGSRHLTSEDLDNVMNVLFLDCPSYSVGASFITS